VEHEIIRAAVVDGLASRDALPSGALEALREVLRRARHRAALVDARAALLAAGGPSAPTSTPAPAGWCR
jgi:hypothetical protein